MTEAAISGGAPAPADSGAPIEAHVNQSEPLGSQVPPKPDAEPDKPEPSKSAGEAIRRANEAVKAKEAATKGEPKESEPAKQPEKAEPKAEAKQEPKPEPKAEQPRDNGRFAAKEPQEEPQRPVEQPKPQADPNSPHREPPQRFDDAAKAEWANAPESIKGAVHRTIRELEQGHQKYRADADAFNEVRQYADMAKQSGTDLKTALSRYVGVEQELRRDPIRGLEAVVANLGLKGANGQPATLRDIAAYVLNQKPDQLASRQEATIQQLNRKIASLEEKLGGVSQSIQEQRTSSIESTVAEFSAKPEHSRFEELADDIKFFLRSDKIDQTLPPMQRLSEAYKLAERLNPAPQVSPNGAHTPTTPLAQTQAAPPPNPAGQKSVSGAPGTGSDPVTPKSGPVPSIREALKRANSRAG